MTAPDQEPQPETGHELDGAAGRGSDDDIAIPHADRASLGSPHVGLRTARRPWDDGDTIGVWADGSPKVTVPIEIDPETYAAMMAARRQSGSGDAAFEKARSGSSRAGTPKVVQRRDPVDAWQQASGRTGTENGAEGDYDVGYRRPPREHRFQPGQSGNPAGRPRGSRNRQRPVVTEDLDALVLSEAYREVRVPNGDEMMTLPVTRVILRTLAAKAAKGNAAAARLLLTLTGRAEDRRSAAAQQELVEVCDYVQGAHRIIGVRARAGRLLPWHLVPHPDDIRFDPHTGEISCDGPLSVEQREDFHQVLETRDWVRDQIAKVQQAINGSLPRTQRAGFTDVVRTAQTQLDELEAQIPPHWIDRRGLYET